MRLFWIKCHWGQRFTPQGGINFSSLSSLENKNLILWNEIILDQMAEGQRFELWVPCGTAVFKTAAINHSAIPPDVWWGEYRDVVLFVKIFFENCISYPPTTISIVELEHIIWDDHPLRTSEFSIFSEGFWEPEEPDERVERRGERRKEKGEGRYFWCLTLHFVFCNLYICCISGSSILSSRWHIPKIQSLTLHFILCTLHSYIHPLIRSDKFFISIISIKNRLQIVYPIVEIDIIFYGYPWKIQCICSYKKWETKVTRHIFAMSPDTRYPKYHSCKKSHQPDQSRPSHDQEIDIRVFMGRIHRQRIDDGNHLDSWDFGEFGDIALCFF